MLIPLVDSVVLAGEDEPVEVAGLDLGSAGALKIPAVKIIGVLEGFPVVDSRPLGEMPSK